MHIISYVISIYINQRRSSLREQWTRGAFPINIVSGIRFPIEITMSQRLSCYLDPSNRPSWSASQLEVAEGGARTNAECSMNSHSHSVPIAYEWQCEFIAHPALDRSSWLAHQLSNLEFSSSCAWALTPCKWSLCRFKGEPPVGHQRPTNARRVHVDCFAVRG